MSVVVAIKEKDRVVIGADSQTTRGESKRTSRNPNNFKVWKVRGVDNCIMAHVGRKRNANIISLMTDLVTEYDVYKGYIDFEFVVKRIVPDIKRELVKYGFMKDDDYYEDLDSRFVFAFQNQLYYINCDGSVVEIDDYVAIGSGEGEAIGSLISTEGLSAEERVIKAIKASSSVNLYVDYPIVIADTKECDFYVVPENEEQEFLNLINSNTDDESSK